MKNPFRKDPQPEVNPPAYPAQRRVFRSEELFQSDREIVILHGDSQYRLQITKAGKLILNK